MNEERKALAACGLICDDQHCDIFQASSDPKIAQEIADWFKRERGEDVKLEDIRCHGCKGDRGKHWSADCWILRCCVDEKGLEFCYECEDFPCEKLEDWSKGDERYGKALERLRATAR